MQDNLKYRYYNKISGKMIYPEKSENIESIYECLKQQINYNINSDDPCQFDHTGNGLIFMQCTGLRDKNNKLIYQGDIVHKKGAKYNGKKLLSRIVFSKDCACFSYSDDLGCHDFRTGAAAKMEVLGNIYETPQLLKKQRQD